MAKAEKPAAARRTRQKVGNNPLGAKRKRKNQPVPTGDAKMTQKRWTDYLAAIANGTPHREASHSIGLTMQTVEAYLISNVSAASQLQEAKVLWNRREWSLEDIESVLTQIAIGKTIKQAFDECGIDRNRVGSLYQLLLRDKALRKWYDEARELATESMADDVIDIADSTHNDRNDDGKIDHEVINRDRLRVQTRQWLMGKFVPKRFGDNKHVHHEGELNINHAAVLSGGRRRIEQLHAKRKGVTIEGEAEAAG